GIFQVVSDVVKLFFKEDMPVSSQENWLFRWGPIASIICVFIAIGSVPMTDAWVLSNVDSGIVLVVCALTLSHLWICWAAYSAESAWSVLSAFRVLALITVYIVPISIALISP